MTSRQNWIETINPYWITLVYVAIVVTLGLALQTWEVVRK